MIRRTKLAADGSDLPIDATHHLAVRIEHDLLARPLIITAYHAPKRCAWKPAQKAAESFDVNGWSWRAPTVDEAAFIPDRSKYPALDKSFFPDLEEYEWIWTSTVDAGSPSDYAWFVGLQDGDVYRSGQSGQFRVRAVRAGQF